VAVNVSSQFQSDIEQYIADETLPLARRQLVVYQFGDPATLPEGRGTTYTATRFNRIPLPYAPLSEGVPPIGETLTISQVSAVAQQWGDKVTITDVGELTIKHPLIKKANELMALQMAETLERNTFNNLNGGTQVNYVNKRGSRALIQSGDVLDPITVNRTEATLSTIGAPHFMGDEETDTRLAAQAGGAKASNNPRTHEHYVGVGHPMPLNDLRQNPTVVTAWSFSDINRLYNNEVGEWGGIIFCRSNMVPSWTGIANTGISPAAGNAGYLAAGTYYIVVTGSDGTNQYESQIYQVSGAVTTSGVNGSISITTPSTPGYTYSAYIGTTTSPGNLATSMSGPQIGPQTGQAVQLPPGTTVILTGIGLAQTPPAAPATGVIVYPTYIFGRGAYAQVVLKDVEWTALLRADKSDPLNQQRVVGWKTFYGTLIENQQFFCRIESSASNTATFT
jgi:N4-gp56 family major capsid protein